MPEEQEDESLVQYFCLKCLGDTWLRIPFTPQFCAHCGVPLMPKRLEIRDTEAA